MAENVPSFVKNLSLQNDFFPLNQKPGSTIIIVKIAHSPLYPNSPLIHTSCKDNTI